MYKNLHLVRNDKFFFSAYNSFEKYYPKQNLFLCLTSIYENKLNIQESNVLYSSMLTFNEILKVKKILRDHEISNVFIHNADNHKINIALDFAKKNKVRLYWIFFGADLYGRLVKDNKYQVYDYVVDNVKQKKSILTLVKSTYLRIFKILVFKKITHYSFEDYCKKIDFFCFWNEFDFKLLVNNYKTKAEFKNFIYLDLLPNINDYNIKLVKSKILVNHNASSYGNHKTIIDKLSSLKTTDNIICPLSYGNETVKKEISKYGKDLFGNQIQILNNFIPKDEYFNLLSDVKVAIFGHRRQEAGANIFAMLYSGVKIFLRNDNNILYWLKKRGFICFSFENDLNSLEDLNPLDEESIKLNQELYLKNFNKEVELCFFNKLLDND